jgi:signal recognition particle subunit SRP54
LSIKSITGKPLKFVGMGERLSELEVFHPDRIASRILGMGDVLTLIEKAQSTIDSKEAEALERKFKKAEFDLEDFRTQMRRIKKLGSLEGIMKLIPGMGQIRKQLQDVSMPEKELSKVEAMISSMTMAERHEPKIINPSRKQRIAKGSGVTVTEVNQLLKNFEQMQKMMKKMAGGKMPSMPQGGRMPGMPGMPGMGAMPGGMPGMPGGLPSGGGGRTAAEAAKLKEKRKKAKKQRRKK